MAPRRKVYSLVVVVWQRGGPRQHAGRPTPICAAILLIYLSSLHHDNMRYYIQ
jgi:hypothetical protein